MIQSASDWVFSVVNLCKMQRAATFATERCVGRAYVFGFVVLVFNMAVLGAVVVAQREKNGFVVC